MVWILRSCGLNRLFIWLESFVYNHLVFLVWIICVRFHRLVSIIWIIKIISIFSQKITVHLLFNGPRLSQWLGFYCLFLLVKEAIKQYSEKRHFTIIRNVFPRSCHFSENNREWFFRTYIFKWNFGVRFPQDFSQLCLTRKPLFKWMMLCFS